VADKIRLAFVGIRSFGAHHVTNVLDHFDEGTIDIVAAIARNPDICPRVEELRAKGARFYPDIPSFYSEQTADLMVISSPIHLHLAHTRQALEGGANVFCEKPVAATIQDALAMEEAERRARGWVAIGFQWSFSEPIQRLKADCMAGRFGAPLCFKTLTCWPRAASYYAGRSWAGAVKSEGGEWVLDGPVSNAAAHFLHNCFYVLGPTRETSATVVDVQAELYRANAIENYDTAALRAHTESGVPILFYASHAVEADIGPLFCYEFEEATVTYAMNAGDQVLVRFRDGRTDGYGDPDSRRWDLIWQQAQSVLEGRAPVCGIAAGLPHVRCSNAVQDSAEVVTFPASLISKQGDPGNPLTVVRGLHTQLIDCFDRALLPSEHGGIGWATAGRAIDLREYAVYPGGRYCDGP
jgi:predicted dehydrogenase